MADLKHSDLRNMIREELKDIKYHPEVIGEIVDLVIGSGNEKLFFKLFYKRLEQIKALKQRVTQLKEFEKLTDYPNLYSMHLSSKSFNLRILYSYNDKDELLLHCFYEREGKTATNYVTHAPIAVQRMKEMEEWL